ncbi:hypothetical protein CVT25_013211 [Psilocybe cyanescens]|uniref:Uncharacterized protein n=1 Tax=Psilocybe cyanescens TaxID=93625 RepID=A0A409XLS7_PSICY|nr:hypothetical protein CVT25_013211 [Psilocybe cyanescens]
MSALGGSAENVQPSVGDVDDDEKRGQRTCCPPLYRDTITNMIERHYCAHPIIPECGPPDPKLIERWAIQRMYDFCVKH